MFSFHQLMQLFFQGRVDFVNNERPFIVVKLAQQVVLIGQFLEFLVGRVAHFSFSQATKANEG
jgi:hypothetical protein